MLRETITRVEVLRLEQCLSVISNIKNNLENQPRADLLVVLGDLETFLEDEVINPSGRMPGGNPGQALGLSKEPPGKKKGGGNGGKKARSRRGLDGKKKKVPRKKAGRKLKQ